MREVGGRQLPLRDEHTQKWLKNMWYVVTWGFLLLTFKYFGCQIPGFGSPWVHKTKKKKAKLIKKSKV